MMFCTASSTRAVVFLAAALQTLFSHTTTVGYTASLTDHWTVYTERILAHLAALFGRAASPFGLDVLPGDAWGPHRAVELVVHVDPRL